MSRDAIEDLDIVPSTPPPTASVPGCRTCGPSTWTRSPPDPVAGSECRSDARVITNLRPASQIRKKSVPFQSQSLMTGFEPQAAISWLRGQSSVCRCPPTNANPNDSPILSQ
jgi:hypothetical protein